MEAIESLKKMIKDWLDRTFPDMPESEKLEISEAMDVTLLEQRKVESMKTFFEINNVIQMSFIEMQYMKKVRGAILDEFMYDISVSHAYVFVSYFSGAFECALSHRHDDECK